MFVGEKRKMTDKVSTDRRIKRSENLIKNAFYELAKEKEITKITVKVL